MACWKRIRRTRRRWFFKRTRSRASKTSTTQSAQIRRVLEIDPRAKRAIQQPRIAQATSGELDTPRRRTSRPSKWLQSSGARTRPSGISTGRPEAQPAEQAFLKAVEVEPQSIIAHRAAATFYLGTGQPLPAERSLRFVADHSGEIEARLALGDYYLITGRRDQGVAEIETARKLPAAKPRRRRALWPWHMRKPAAGGRKDLDELLAKHARSPRRCC